MRYLVKLENCRYIAGHWYDTPGAKPATTSNKMYAKDYSETEAEYIADRVRNELKQTCSLIRLI